MIRIKDIAELAGVSTTTVSNVIHGNTKKVSPDNIERIQALLEKTGYIPSMGARMLAGKCSNIIGVITDEYKEKGRRHITDPFLSAILGAVESEIYENGYYMFYHQAENPENIRQLVSTWNVDGIITIGITEKDNLELHRYQSTPIVSIDNYYEEKEVVNIGLDDYGGGWCMAEYILAQGFEGLCFLADNDVGVDHMRWLGVRDAMVKAGTENPHAYHIILPRDRNLRERLHKENLSMYLRCGALFFASDFYAVEGMSLFQEQGIRIPADLSVAGFDDNFLATTIKPELTTVRQDIEAKGRLAVKSLVSLIRQEGVTNPEIRLPVELIVRKTVARRKDFNDPRESVM